MSVDGARRRVKSGNDLIEEARTRVREVTPEATLARVAAEPNVLLLDIREPNEWNLGHAPKALFMPRGTLETTIESVVERDRPVVVYCASGNRSALAADTLQQMGYTDVVSLIGGFRGWVEAGGDIDDD
ncbi:MAG: sulfurtransferase [Cytophagaceae bacterium]|nr:sulfurtransferase [Gemmatimonadaceae bacterium]